jgi:hypothetical protein
MQKRERRISPREMAANRARMVALRNLPDYAPRNPEYSVEAIEANEASFAHLEREEQLAIAHLATIRAQLRAEGVRYDKRLDGAVAEAEVQYGKDSAAVRSLR